MTCALPDDQDMTKFVLWVIDRTQEPLRQMVMSASGAAFVDNRLAPNARWANMAMKRAGFGSLMIVTLFDAWKETIAKTQTRADELDPPPNTGLRPMTDEEIAAQEQRHEETNRRLRHESWERADHDAAPLRPTGEIARETTVQMGPWIDPDVLENLIERSRAEGAAAERAKLKAGRAESLIDDPPPDTGKR